VARNFNDDSENTVGNFSDDSNNTAEDFGDKDIVEQQDPVD
jgi:hypothetical protein